ncbi:hypothetical protein CAOG_009406 [Capsaspora owczarzaki ATCC 30864]|uniref:Uncharacterized protein n=1 Tax=Capsaspora owczarzaki (strain ATCC 30864) TaxID=595528 RepID=A0A0D2U3U7_CAPO3|nr:hypothetical protein CAOG_009406 [Capsaspora owczarzaki ATCC 30864]
MPGVKRTAAGRPRRSTRNTTAAAAASNASFDAAAAASDDAEGEVISVSSSSAAGSSEVVSAADEDEDDHATRPKRARRVAAARGSTSTIGDSPVATRQPALAPAAAAAAAAAIATRRVPAPRTAKPIPASLLVDDESNSDEDDFMPSSASGSQASQPTPMRGMASSSPGVTPARRFAHKSTDVLNADVNNQAMHVDDDDDDDDDDWSALASPIQGAKLARPTRARRATRNSNSNSTPARKRFGRAVSSDSDDGSFHQQ